jgi:2-(1,2-epoxy-1,2-dihydrophenyl)acetyl-CoA isomerase
MTATLDIAGGIARLHLNAPETGNAIGPAMAESLVEHTRTLAGLPDVRVVLLTAEGTAFCVGGDVRYFAEADDPSAAIRELAGNFHVALTALATLDAPVVTAVEGVAAGGGLSVAVTGDLVIASPQARFTSAYTRIGLSPDGGQSWLLPRLVGQRRAAELLLTNRTVGAEEARDLGLVTEVSGDALARATELAEQLAAGPAGAHAAVKRLLLRSSSSAYVEQLAAEADAIATLAGTPEGREGVAAFVAKRAPDFRES